jgi:hypothetical protein
MNANQINANIKKIELNFAKKQAKLAANIPAEIIKKAQKEGAKDYQSGKKGMPMSFTEYACKSEYSTLALMEAYNHGREIARLAGIALDEEFPSVKELNWIMA